MTQPIDVNIRYNSAVVSALRGGQQVLDQIKELQNLQFENIQAVDRLDRTIRRMGDNAKRAFGEATRATKDWTDQLLRADFLISRVFTSISSATQSFGTSIRSALGRGVGGIDSIANGATSFISNFSRSLTDFIGTGGITQQLGRAVSAAARGIIGVGGRIGEFILQGVSTTLSTLPRLLGEVTKVSGNVASLLGGGIAQAFGGPGLLTGVIVSGISNAAGAVQKALGDVLGGLGDIASSAFGGLAQAAAESVGSAIDIIASLGDRLADTVGRIGETAGQAFGAAFAASAAIAIPVGISAVNFREGLSAAFGVVVDELNESQFERLVRGAKEVASNVGIALNQVPQALFKAVSPGFTSITQSVEDLTAGAKLAAIGNVELFTAIDTGNVVLDSYGRELEDLESISVKLFNATRLGRLEINELTNTIGLVSGVAANAGIPLEDLLTTINLAQRSLPASRAVTGLANAIGKLQRPAERTRKEFAEFFDQIQDGAGGIISFRRVFEALDQLGIFRDPERLRRIFPDERGIRSITAAMSQFLNEAGTYDRVLSTIVEGNSAFERTSERAFSTISRALTRVAAQAVSVGDSILEKIRPAVVAGADAFRDILRNAQRFIESIDEGSIEAFTSSITSFVRTVPSRLASVVDFFGQIKDSILGGAQAVKVFLDEQVNLSRSFDALFSGDFERAFDLLFGSPAINKVKQFFQTIRIEAESVIQRVTSLFSGASNLITQFATSTVQSNPILRLGSALVPDSGPSSPLRTALQAGFGVDPLQGAASVATGAASTGAIGGGIGAILGGGLGLLGGPFAPITVPFGAALGGAGGGIGGALGGGVNASRRVDATRSRIDQFLEQQEQENARITEETRRRKQLVERLNEVFEQYSAIINNLVQIEADIASTEAERASKVKNLRAEQEFVIQQLAQVEATILEIETEAGADIEDAAAIIAERKSTEEIKLRQSKRQAEILRRETVIRERIERELASLTVEIEKQRRALNPTRNVIATGAVPGSADDGAPIPTSLARFADLVGGADERRLVPAIRDLIRALEENTNAEKAVKEALEPFNLNSNLRGLNTRSRVQIRRAQEARQQALADSINARFAGRGLGDIPLGFGSSTSLFGFGDRGTGGRFGSSLRAAAFGGPFGFGTSLPGESRRPDDAFARAIRNSLAEFFGLSGFGGAFVSEPGFTGGVLGGESSRSDSVSALLRALSSDRFGFLSPLSGSGAGGRTGEPFIDVGELLPGAPSRRGRIRGGRRGRDPFGTAEGDVIQALKNVILELADATFAGPEDGGGRLGRERIKDLTDQAAKSLDIEGEALNDGKNQIAILERVADLLEKGFERDKLAAERAEKSEELKAARDELSEAEGRKRDLEEGRGSARAAAEAGLAPVDSAAIRASFLEKEEARIAAITAERDKLDEEVLGLEIKIGEANREALEKFNELSARFVEVLGMAQEKADEFTTNVIDAINQQLDIGQNFQAILDGANERFLEVLKRQSDQQREIERLRQKVEKGR